MCKLLEGFAPAGWTVVGSSLACWMSQGSPSPARESIEWGRSRRDAIADDGSLRVAPFPIPLCRGRRVSHPHTERVLVVPAAELDRLGRFQGFQRDAGRYLDALLVPELASFRLRSEVEDDPGFKQIIPYVVFL